MNLNAWFDFENEFGNEKQIEFIKKKLPSKVKRKRPILNADGVTKLCCFNMAAQIILLTYTKLLEFVFYYDNYISNGDKMSRKKKHE